MITNEKQYVAAFARARHYDRAAATLEGRRSQLAAAGRADQAAVLNAMLTGMRLMAGRLRRLLSEYDEAHAADRQGAWMPTFTGRRFWLLDPRPGDIDVLDIAQGLSRISRYNGMTSGTVGYTVAQHSVLASFIVPTQHRLHALMHDAPEAYAGDVISPLKALLGKMYEDIEDRIMRAVAAAFGVVITRDGEEAVKWADRVLLATEVRDLLPCQVIRQDPGEEPLPLCIDPWTQERSRAEFLRRFEELTRG